MATLTSARPELFNQVEVGKILKLKPKTVGEIAPRLGFTWKRHPHRSGVPRFLDRNDVSRLGEVFNTEPNWSALSA